MAWPATRLRLPAAAALAGALLAVPTAGCGSTSGAGATGGDPLHGDLTVLAAASLTDVFGDIRTRLVGGHPGLAVTDSFAGSQELVAQVEQGAPADVVATADQASMARLVAAHLVDTPRVFARNLLEIVVAPGNPRGIRGLADLARPGLKVVLEDPSVPAGRYARQALTAARVPVSPVSLPLDVRSELLQVEEGNADAGIVYTTDVAAAGSKVAGVPIPASQNVVAVYPIAVVTAGRNRAAATAYVEEVVGALGRAALDARGFLPP